MTKSASSPARKSRKPSAVKSRRSPRSVTGSAATKAPPAEALPADHPTMELLPNTSMNFVQLEAAIDALWQRNLAARKRLGLRPNQDIRSIQRPKGMKAKVFEALTAEVDDATFGFLEGLAAMWGHSIDMWTDADHFLFLKAPDTRVAGGAKKTATAKVATRKETAGRATTAS